MDKLTNSIGVHLTDEDARAVRLLADMASSTPSGYIRDLVIEHLRAKRSEFESMREIFGAESSRGSFGSEARPNEC